MMGKISQMSRVLFLETDDMSKLRVDSWPCYGPITIFPQTMVHE